MQFVLLLYQHRTFGWLIRPGLADPAHPVSIAIEKMKEVEEVRIIEGLDENNE